MKIRGKTEEIIRILKKEYPRAGIALSFSNHMQLLAAVILSAQCTDKRVNIITRDLFKKYRKVTDFADADIRVFEQEIRSAGFFRHKAGNIIAAAGMIRKDFRGRVPRTMEELLKLPGVARKTANIILYNAFAKNDGIAVDTHVRRLAIRMGLTKNNRPEAIENDLMKTVLRRDWGKLNDLMVEHGRRVCLARTPLCVKCAVQRQCHYFQKQK